MEMHASVKLSREVEATLVPSGEKIKLDAGTEVRVTQSLGGNYTVMTDHGYMAQIDGRDADAIGKDKSVSPADQPGAAGKSVSEVVWDTLKTCYDPEIPVNIVDLGLVYDCKVIEMPEGGHRVNVKMTLTAPGCGMGTVLTAQAQSKILAVPGVKEADVELVWEPQWNPSLMSEAAKLQLGML